MIIFYFHPLARIFCDSFFIKNNPDFWNEICNDLTGIFLEHVYFQMAHESLPQNVER